MSSVAQIQFKDLVRRDFVCVDLEATDREDALNNMAQYLVDIGYCTEEFPHAIIHRERNHPSGLPMRGPKIAIPHTDSTYVLESAIVFARLTRPVPFHVMGSPEETIPVQLISMFALRESSMIGDLLETLLTAYQDPQLLETLLRVSSAEEAYHTLWEALSGNEL